MKGRMLAVVLALAVIAPVLWAATDAETISMAGIPSLVLSVDGDSGSVAQVDSGLVASKRAALVTCTVNGQAVYLLVRVQRASNGLFVDLVADESLSALDTRLDALDLSTAVPAHPSPDRDAVDDEPYLSAGGT